MVLIVMMVVSRERQIGNKSNNKIRTRMKKCVVSIAMIVSRGRQVGKSRNKSNNNEVRGAVVCPL